MAVSAPRAAPMVAVLARGIEGRMTMVTHTAGPWTFESTGQGDFVIYGNISPNRNNAVLCQRGFWGTNAVQSNANARLIASAPDLLALAHQYRNDLRYPPTADSITRRLAAIDAVLAKVTGE